MSQNSIPERQAFTVKEVAALLGFSTNSVYKFLKQGRIQGERLGRGRFRIPRAEVERFLSHEQHPGHEGDEGPLPESASHAAVAVAAPVPDPGSVLRGFHPIGRSDIFDWYVGFTLVLEGVALLLLPVRIGPAVVASALGLGLAVVCGVTGLGFLWAILRGEEQSRLSRLARAAVAVCLVLLAAYAGLAARDAYGVIEFSLILVTAAFAAVFPPVHGKRFAVLLAALGLGAGLLLLRRPADAGIPALVALLQAQPLSVSFGGVLLTGLFLGAVRWSARRSTALHVALFALVGALALALAALQVTRGALDHAAFALVLGTFALLFPFRFRFAGLPARHHWGITAAFAWLGTLLVVFVLLTRLVQWQIERTYAESAVRAAERAQQEIESYMRSLRAAAQAPAGSELLRAALAARDLKALADIVRTAYQGAASALHQVSILDETGAVLTQYPVGSLPPAERAAVDASIPRNTAAGSEGSALVEVVFREGGEPPTLIVRNVLAGVSGSPAGFLILSGDGGALHDRLRALRFRENGGVAVADQRGRYVFHRVPALIGSGIQNDRALQGAVRGERVVGKVPVDGSSAQHLAAALPVPAVGWGVAAEHSVPEAYRSASVMLFTVFLGVLSAAVSGFAVILRVLRPHHRVSIVPSSSVP